MDVPSEWLDIDWPAHSRTEILDGCQANVIEIGSGPLMVFVHGLGGSWQNWLENLPHFARTHRCVALDLPGFGASDPVDGDVSIERYARMVAELIDEPAVVVGNSMGGFIALELAIKQPDHVSKLVLVSAAVLWQEYRRARPLVTLANVTEGVVGRALADAPELLVKRPKVRQTALRFGGIRKVPSPELQRELILTARRTPGFLPALKALSDYPLREDLPSVRCPTLIVWGDKDPLVDVSHARELGDAIPGARVSIYERTGHVVQLERPERFNAEVAAFVDE